MVPQQGGAERMFQRAFVIRPIEHGALGVRRYETGPSTGRGENERDLLLGERVGDREDQPAASWVCVER